MRYSAFARLTLLLAPLSLSAQTDIRGIYIYTNDLAQISKPTATALTQSFSTPGVDGVAIVVGWNTIEPSRGQFDWTLLDQWVGQVAALGKKIDLVIPAGSSTPSWLFDAAPQGAGAVKLSFNISPHGGQTGVCDATTLAPPWDPAFLTQWDAMLAAVSAHLKSAGTYSAVTLVRLTGINRTTEEMRLPAETPASTGLACVTDSITTWQKAGYKPSLLLKGWNAIVGSFQKSFPDKSYAVSIIPNNAFPGIAEDGTAIKGALGDQNEPLLQSASQTLPTGTFVVQFDFLMPGEAASSVVTGAAQNYGTMVAFQTNEYLGTSGAACSEPVTNPTPCTASTFLTLLETGIYPLGPGNPLRAQFIEVFHDNVTAFPVSVLQAHNELIASPSPTVSTSLIPSPDGSTVYDPVNNITWLANFNLAASNRFGMPVCKGPGAAGCVNPSGSMHWDAAVSWIAAMNAASYLGQSNWQFPTTPNLDPNCAHTGPGGNSFSFGCTASALANLYNNGLGLQSPATAVPIPANTVGSFNNFQPYLYWTSGNAAANGYSTVSFNSGFAGSNTGPNFLYVIPMIPGKITGAPAGSTVYDSTANVTWLANANLAATNTFGVPVCTNPTTPTLCIAPDGAMSWDSANQWIKNMNAAAYLGQKTWQLPPGDPTCNGYACSSNKSPLAELYSGLLNLTGGTPVIPALTASTGPFTNIQPYLYWSCTGDTIQSPCSSTPPAPNFEWTYSLGNGFTGTDVLNNTFYVAAYFVGAPAWYTPPAVSISTAAALPAATVGTAYSQTLAASGGTPPYTWSLSTGTLPDGLTLASNGVISGTPTTAGTFTFTLQVMDSNSTTATLAATLTIQAAALPVITSITVSNQQTVLGSDGNSINSTAGFGPAPDEHSSMFAPGTLGTNQDYVFFLASGSAGNPGIGLIALSGGNGPAKNGQWTLALPTKDGYGNYPGGFGQIFNTAMKPAVCPNVADGNPAHQDQTFDLHYASAGSVMIDPTGPAGSLLMIYEGTNACIGTTGGAVPNTVNDYISLAVATSLDYGKSWPTYRSNFVALPNVNATQGPNAPMGAMGKNVCMGNDCTSTPPANYGRYPVITTSKSLASLMAAGKQLTAKYGEQEIAGFVDDASGYVYATFSSASMGRAKLNGGSAPLSFLKWDGQGFNAPGLGGAEPSVIPAGAYENCGVPAQNQFGSSISYVEDTQQYLLTFLCISSHDPALGKNGKGNQGAAWFYSTSYDLSDPSKWSTPTEIAGSWNEFDTSGSCNSYNGFYPTFMSLGKKPAHLSTSGYVFYLWGCQTEGTPSPGRRLASRQFVINTSQPSSPPVSISTSAQLPAGQVGTGYSQTLAASAGTPPYTWSLSTGTLPDGLTFASNGVISGTPTTAGTSAFTLQVTDSNSTTATLAATLVILPPPSPTSVTFYVSPSGNDSWSGLLSAPTSDGTDGPFATFDAARMAVQSLNKANLTQITVQFRAGTYYLSSAEQFTSADSGTASTPITYQNYPGETPIFSGGMTVQNWTNAGGNKWTATLPASTQYFENLYYNGARRLRPRLGGSLGTYYRIAKTIYLAAAAPPAKAPDPNCPVYIAGFGWECFDRFGYNPSDPIAGTWKNLAPAKGNPCNQPAGNSAIEGDIEVLDWEQFSTSKLRISCIDTTNHIVYMTGPTAASQTKPSEGGFVAGNRYLVDNVQDALTQPGQWFLDHSAKTWTLTYLANPGENPNTDQVIIPQATQVLVGYNLQYVTFQGLTFEHDNYTVPAAGHKSVELEADISAAVSFQNSQNITLDGLTVTQVSGTGIELISCVSKGSPAYCVNTDPNASNANNVIQNTAVFDVGALGIRIGDPYVPADTDANVAQSILVQNNVVEGYGRTIPASFGIGQGNGHDNLYTHNDVYDGYHCAISISWQAGFTTKPPGIGIANNTISFNHVYNLLQGIMNDGGSIRIDGGNNAYTGPGNKILNNRIHDTSDASALDSNGYGGDGIYLDNQTGLVDVENNLVYRVSGNAVYTPQGPSAPKEANIVKNNILAFARLSMLSINQPYPYGVPAVVPQNFNFSNNLMYFDRNNSSTPKFWVQGGCVYPAGAPYTQFQQFSSNLYWRTDGTFASDAKAFTIQPNAVSTGPNVPCTGNTNDYTFYTFAAWQALGEDLQSIVKNPGFKNPAYPADDFTLPAGSPGVGFLVFDYTQAGRSNPVLMPPSIPPTFPTKPFDPSKDY